MASWEIGDYQILSNLKDKRSKNQDGITHILVLFESQNLNNISLASNYLSYYFYTPLIKILILTFFYNYFNLFISYDIIFVHLIFTLLYVIIKGGHDTVDTELSYGIDNFNMVILILWYLLCILSFLIFDTKFIIF